MLWVVSYDVSDDALRDRVATILEEFGVRVQWSVFECRVGPRSLSELQRRLGLVLREPSDGNVRGYRVCGKCSPHGWTLGATVDRPGARPYLIV